MITAVEWAFLLLKRVDKVDWKWKHISHHCARPKWNHVRFNSDIWVILFQLNIFHRERRKRRIIQTCPEILLSASHTTQQNQSQLEESEIKRPFSAFSPTLNKAVVSPSHCPMRHFFFNLLDTHIARHMHASWNDEFACQQTKKCLGLFFYECDVSLSRFEFVCMCACDCVFVAVIKW